jgi:ABC-2 type transport system ATP-binding protein
MYNYYESTATRDVFRDLEDALDMHHVPNPFTAHGPPPPAISIRDLRVRRGGKVILDDLTLTVPAGSVTGLLGPSGSGKSTLIRAIVGVQIVEAGSVTVLGQDAGSHPLRSRIGYVTQAPSVYGDLTVRENLRYFAKVLGAPSSRVNDVLATVDLESRAGQLTASLSGGQRMRVSLATALLNEPDLLVLDEPTVGLDPVLRRDLWETFIGLARRGTTLLVSSHVMDEAARCDELLLLRDGGLLAAMSPDDLRAHTGERDLEAAFLHLAEETHS